MAALGSSLGNFVEENISEARQLLSQLDAFDAKKKETPIPFALQSLVSLRAEDSRDSSSLSWKKFTRLDLKFEELTETQLSQLTERGRRDYEAYTKTCEDKAVERTALRLKKIAYIFLRDKEPPIRSLDRLVNDYDMGIDRWLPEVYDPSHVEYLLQLGCSPDARDSRGDSALSKAALWGHGETVKILIQRGAKLDFKDSRGLSALHCALGGEYTKIAKLLINTGADLGARNSDNQTPYHVALRKGLVEIANLLTNGKVDVHAVDYSGNTPLHEALRGGLIEIARTLIERGAKVNAKGASNETPYHLALEGGHAGIADLLNERGADFLTKDRRGNTSLHKALEGGLTETAKN